MRAENSMRKLSSLDSIFFYIEFVFFLSRAKKGLIYFKKNHHSNCSKKATVFEGKLSFEFPFLSISISFNWVLRVFVATNLLHGNCLRHNHIRTTIKSTGIYHIICWHFVFCLLFSVLHSYDTIWSSSIHWPIRVYHST